MPTSGLRSLSKTCPATPSQAQPKSLAKFATSTLLPGCTTNGASVVASAVGGGGAGGGGARGAGEGVGEGVEVTVAVGVQVGGSWISGILVVVGNPKVGGIVGAASRSGPGRNGSMTSIRPGLAKTAAMPLALISDARTKTKLRQLTNKRPRPRLALGL